MVETLSINVYCEFLPCGYNLHVGQNVGITQKKNPLTITKVRSYCDVKKKSAKKKKKKKKKCLRICGMAENIDLDKNRTWVAIFVYLHNLWVRLKFTGDGEAPSRDYVAEELILQTTWINAHDIYSIFALPNKRDFELCFFQESTLQLFLEVVLSRCNEPNWKERNIESSLKLDVTNVVVKFWTGQIPDQDIELYLKRYYDILQPANKPVNKFGIWFGVRKYKVCMRKDSSGRHIQIPNSISLGPYNGHIIYPGQVTKCFICQSVDHQAKDCPTVKCWRCGNLGHKARECQRESECSLCGHRGHTFYNCPMSYSNKAKSAIHPTALMTSSIF
uniref:CCHC-type domain-containing protein n=1 Tax=Mola mola TaxID=94237 RepID=A0A3Q3W2B4_MOLML